MITILYYTCMYTILYHKIFGFYTVVMVISTGHLGQTSDKPAILVIVTEIGQLYLQKGRWDKL